MLGCRQCFFSFDLAAAFCVFIAAILAKINDADCFHFNT